MTASRTYFTASDILWNSSERKMSNTLFGEESIDAITEGQRDLLFRIRRSSMFSIDEVKRQDIADLHALLDKGLARLRIVQTVWGVEFRLEARSV
jgi:hypothetical protein